jgi:S4 domain protein YaaA
MNDQHEEIKITTQYITLGQFIKLANIFESGGMIKSYLKDEGVLVNNEIEHRRGRKLYVNDVVEFEQAGKYIVTQGKN